MSPDPNTLRYPYARSADQDAVAAVHHPVVVTGAGPVGLVLAIDLAQRGVPVLLLDETEAIGTGPRAIAFARHTLEILDRIGCGAAATAQGLGWGRGRVFFGDTEVQRFEAKGGPGGGAGERHPAFLNLPQYRLEAILLARLAALADQGAPVALRGRNRIAAVGAHHDHVRLEIDTPEGPYSLECGWLVACDGANSAVRRMLGLEFPGLGHDGAFLVADVALEAGAAPEERPAGAERRFWFDPPFAPGGTALLHRQPGGLWRVELQLEPGADPAAEAEAGRAEARIGALLAAVLGAEARFAVRALAPYRFHCRRMERFLHGRVIFAGDAAHQVSPFGARGANGGIHDAANLGWKLAAVLGGASERLLESYNWERMLAADENIRASAQASDFVTPRTQVGRDFRDAVLDLAARHGFARPMVNAGRLSVPCVYDDGPLNGPDAPGLPARTRPGAPAAEAPLQGGWLLDRLGPGFTLLAVDVELPADAPVPMIHATAAGNPELAARWCGPAAGVVALIRPDGHVAARWTCWDGAGVAAALARAG